MSAESIAGEAGDGRDKNLSCPEFQSCSCLTSTRLSSKKQTGEAQDVSAASRTREESFPQTLAPYSSRMQPSGCPSVKSSWNHMITWSHPTRATSFQVSMRHSWGMRQHQPLWAALFTLRANVVSLRDREILTTRPGEGKNEQTSRSKIA